MNSFDNFIKGPLTSIIGLVLLIACAYGWYTDWLTDLQAIGGGIAGFLLLRMKDEIPGFIKSFLSGVISKFTGNKDKAAVITLLLLSSLSSFGQSDADLIDQIDSAIRAKPYSAARAGDMHEAIVDAKLNKDSVKNGLSRSGGHIQIGGELLNDTTLIYGDPHTTGSAEIPRRLIFNDTDVAFKTSYNDGIDSVLLLMSFIGPLVDANQNGVYISTKVADSDFQETALIVAKDAITLASGTANEGEGTTMFIEGNALSVSNTVGAGGTLTVSENSVLSSGNTSINMGDGTYSMISTNSVSSPSATYQQSFTGSQSSLSLTRSNGSQTIGFGGSGITLGTDTDGTPQTRLTIANNGTLTLASALTAANGGTGQSSVTTGDMLYGSGFNAWGKLGVGSAGQFLSVSGGVPAWSSLTASNGVTKSGNNFSWGGGLTAPVNIFGAQPVVIGGGPSIQSFGVYCDDGSDITSTLDMSSSVILGHSVISSNTSAELYIDAGTESISMSVNSPSVTSGIDISTQRIQLKQGGLVPGSAFVGIQTETANTDALAVYEDGNSLIFSAGETSGQRYVRFGFGSDATGDMIYRNSSGNYQRLGIGSAEQFLSVSGGVPAWSSLTASNGITKSGNNFSWGGGLTSSTLVDGNGQALEFGTSGSNLSAFRVRSNDVLSLAGFDATISSSAQSISLNGSTQSTFNTVGFSLVSNSTNILLTDNRTTKRGIQYAADYSANYTVRSLTDKEYVDGGVLKGTSTLDFADTPSLGQAELTISVTGAAVGDPVSVGTPAAPSSGVFTAYVSSANTVTVRYSNTTGSSVDPASASYTVAVIKR